MRLCPFSHCFQQLNSDTFACRRHWKLMTYRNRTRILRIWNLYLQKIVTFEHLRKIQEEVIADTERLWTDRQQPSK